MFMMHFHYATVLGHSVSYCKRNTTLIMIQTYRLQRCNSNNDVLTSVRQDTEKNQQDFL